MRRRTEGRVRGCEYVGVHRLDEEDARSGDSRFIENKGKRMKNWEDDGVRLRLSIEKEREIGENIRTRVRERRERPRGANRECVGVGER